MDEKYLEVPAVYIWSMKKESCEKYGIPFDKESLKEGFADVYVGIAKNMNQRARWHWIQKFSPSAVRGGFISTLNQTLASILEITYTDKDYLQIKTFMKENMKLRVYKYCSSKEEARSLEKELLNTGDYALNLEGNKKNPFYSRLKVLRSSCKIRSLEKTFAREL